MVRGNDMGHDVRFWIFFAAKHGVERIFFKSYQFFFRVKSRYSISFRYLVKVGSTPVEPLVGECRGGEMESARRV